MDALLQLKESLAERYDIKREIGAGGMATVFLAQDLRHDRPVALKLLNPELGAVLGVERFLAEIRVTANLQHPNLLPLFDSGAADGLLFYVMPFVEGESLRARLDREKQLPVDEAVRMTVAIANALDYAHSHGVIHRDLKPENILLQAGQPVIADFGIALAVSNAGGNRITQTGLSLGTPQYMSPEQATGDRVIDGRSDIYSLGAVAYEMLTGDPPHTGSTSQAIIARMLTEKPRPMRVSRSAIPEHVEYAVQHALEKLPADRFSSAREFADALQGRGASGATTSTQIPGTWNRGSKQTLASRLRDPVTISLVAALIAAIAFGLLRKPPERPPMPVVRYVLWTPDSLKPIVTFPWPGALSPDGGTLVYALARGAGLASIRTNQLDPRPIPGTEEASQVVFSPDGQWVAFEAKGKVRKVRLDGSSPSAVTDGQSDNGADWTSRDEIILGSEGVRHGLSRTSANGGDLLEFVKPDRTRGETDYVWPVATPDGKRVVFTIWTGSLASSTLGSVSIEGGEVSRFGIKSIRPVAIVDRTLVYVQADGSVMAARLNRSATALDGPAIPVHDPVFVTSNVNGNSEIFVSKGGALLTSRGGTSSRLVWVSKDGTTTPVFPDVHAFGGPRISPDGHTVAVTVADGDRSDLWLYDLVNRTFSRLTSLKAVTAPAWSPDGSKVFFAGLDEKERFAIWSQAADGSAQAEKVADVTGPASGVAVARDGKAILYVAIIENSWNIYKKEIGRPEAAQPFIHGPLNAVGPTFSPDGRWVAFTSDQTGRNEVVVVSYANPSARLQISTSGGAEPIWARDGTRLFYRESGGALMSAKIVTSPTVRVMARDTVNVGAASLLSFGLASGYDVSDDGRFIARLSNRDDYQLVVVPNWRIELEQRLANLARH